MFHDAFLVPSHNESLIQHMCCNLTRYASSPNGSYVDHEVASICTIRKVLHGSATFASSNFGSNSFIMLHNACNRPRFFLRFHLFRSSGYFFSEPLQLVLGMPQVHMMAESSGYRTNAQARLLVIDFPRMGIEHERVVCSRHGS